MKRIPFLFIVLIPALLLWACSKSEDPVLKNNENGFDPRTDFEAVNRVLQVMGSYLENMPLPSKSAPRNITAFGLSAVVSPPALFIINNWQPKVRIDTIEIGNEIPAFIPLRFTDFPNPAIGSYFKPVNAYLKVSGAKGRWKIPLTETPGTNVALNLAVPALVREGSCKITLCTEFSCRLSGYDTLRIFTDTVNAVLSIRTPVPCGSDPYFGRYGLTVKKFSFEDYDKPGKVKVRFRTFGVPDRLEIRYGGQYVVSSCSQIPAAASLPKCPDGDCFIITNTDWKDYEFNFDPAKGKFAEALITGWCQDTLTQWSLEVGCPE